MKEQQIVVVDDEKEIADLVEVYLQNEGYRVFTYYNASDALKRIQEGDIDLAVLDVMLPDMDGFTLCREIRKDFFFPIIMLTAKVEEMDRINGIVMGADDYLTKPFLPLELVARVKGQLRRAGQYNRELKNEPEAESYELRGLELDAMQHTCRLYGEDLNLTPTEFDIMLYLCRHMNQAVTSEELFEAVWKEQYFESNNTVFVHIARLREKMKENSRKPKFIKTVWGVGYKLEDN